VIIIHRLLKNEVVETLGIEAYALFTQACIEAMAIDPEALGMQELVETYEHLGQIPTWAHDLERRWSEEEERQRVFVTPDVSWFTESVATNAPPQLAWEFVTKPGRRPSWQLGVTEVLTDSPDGRRTVGAINHCRHGPDGEVVEEILDWRPYDYLSDLGTHMTPSGPVQMLETIEFEPTTTGTIIHFRYAPPENVEGQEAMKSLEPMYREVFAGRLAALAAQLDAALVTWQADQVDEPELPEVRRDGVLAGLRPPGARA
jgi:uncharacterized protein YndB with AHSA1/START domain